MQVIFAPGTMIGGRYRLKEELAKGGMGSIWVARHLQLDVDVAIKFMDPEVADSPLARARFEREARASAQLQYIHIVHVYDFGFEGDTPYLVMELLRGESLEDRLQREGRLSMQALSPIVVQVVKGLRKAHEAGFVHRDLKPGNVFIAKSEDEELVKLVDFGIAKKTGGAIDSGTAKGELIGSPHYMSPEQLQDPSNIDGRSDLWALGVIIYRALTGELPFPGETLGVVMKHVLIGPTPKASPRAPDLPGAIDDFFERAFAKDREQRFLTARDFADAFLALAGAERPSALPAARESASPWGTSRPPPAGAAPAPITISEQQTRRMQRDLAPPGPSAADRAPSVRPTAPIASMAPTAEPGGGFPDRALGTLETVQRKVLARPWVVLGSLLGVALVGGLLAVVAGSRSGSSPARGSSAGAAASETPEARGGIPKGSAKVTVSATGRVCKVTINSTNHGYAPVSTLIPPGLSRIYCITPSGSTERREVSAVEGQSINVVFE
jgi:serine/threonine-protein kinase